MSEQQLTVRLIRIEGIAGIEGPIEIQPGAMTMLEGKNGRGKSSVIDALLALLGSGDASELLRVGAERGEVYAELSDGTWFRRQITPTSNQLTAGNPETGRISKAATYLRSLISIAALDPAAFLAADDVKRAQMVLQVAPLKVTQEELRAALKPVLDVGLPVILDRHALAVIDDLLKMVYDKRTGVNAIARDKEAAARDLRATLPESNGRDNDDVTEALRSAQEDRRLLAEQVDAAAQSIRNDMEERKRHAEQVRDEAIAAAHKAFTEALNQAQEHKEASLAALQAKAGPQLHELDEEIGRLHEQTKHAERFAGTQRRIIEIEAEAAKAKERSKELTAAMARLDALKSEKATQLPLKNVAVVDGALHVKLKDGASVPSTRANRAEQIKLALRLAAMQNTKVKFIVADSLEALDGETRAQLEKAAVSLGLQIIAARVTDDEELTVRTTPAVLA